MGTETKAELKNLEAELVVIGGGGSGLTAATAALENGIKKVIVLEKRRTLGGNSIRAGDIFACESPVQQKKMVIATKDEYFKILTKWSHWDRINPRVVRAFINKSGDTIGWLQQKGINFALQSFYPNQKTVGHFATEGGGFKLIRTLTKNIEDLGGQILLDTGAKELLLGSKGEIKGLVAIDKEGKEFHINTRRVIIASGGIGGNKELLKKHCPPYFDGMRLHGFAHTGDGLIIAEKAGAAIADTIPMLKEGPNPDCGELLSLKMVVNEPYTLWINKLGERFVDETTGYIVYEAANAILRQPGKISYTVFDNKIRQRLQERGLPVEVDEKHPEKAKMPDLVSELDRQQANDGVVKIANTWEEMAQKLGVDPAVLISTIDKYNSYCDHGYDDEFYKDRRYLAPLLEPPYYAVRCSTTFLDTLGGIKVNERMEVQDKQGKVIPGLYAAGVIADGFQSDTYCVELCGTALGFAVNSGRIAGENSAKFV